MMGLFNFNKGKKAPKTGKSEAASAQAAGEPVDDVTELMAAIAILNDEKPSSGHAVVSAALISPISAQIKKEQEKAAAEAAAEKEANPEIGDQMQDGSVYAGLTADGTQKIFAMPTDLDVIMIFNYAAKRVTELNAGKALDHDDWQIPDLKTLRVMQKNQNKGKLQGTFKPAESSVPGYPDWYWSSTESPYDLSVQSSIGFSNGNEGLLLKGLSRLNCRPVRLVPVASKGKFNGPV